MGVEKGWETQSGYKQDGNGDLEIVGLRGTGQCEDGGDGWPHSWWCLDLSRVSWLGWEVAGSILGG